MRGNTFQTVPSLTSGWSPSCAPLELQLVINFATELQEHLCNFAGEKKNHHIIHTQICVKRHSLLRLRSSSPSPHARDTAKDTRSTTDTATHTRRTATPKREMRHGNVLRNSISACCLERIYILSMPCNIPSFTSGCLRRMWYSGL